MDRAFRLVVWIVIPALGFLALFAIGRALWLDDTHSTFHAFDGPLRVVDHLRSDSHPPLYFLLLSIWMKIVGMGEIALRVPSILFWLGAGAILFMYGRSSDDPRLGVLFAVFFLFNPVAVGHAHTIRPYGLAGLLAAASTVAYLRVGDTGRPAGRGIWSAYLMVNALGTLTHYWFFFLLSGQGVGALLALRGRRGLQVVAAIALSAIPFALVWAPVLLGQLGGAPTSWMTAPGGFWLVSAPLQLMGGRHMYDFRPAAKVFYGLLLLACVLRTHPRLGVIGWPEVKGLLTDRRTWLAAAVPATVMVIALVLSQVRPVYHVKYTIVAIPAFAMFLGLLIARLADRRLAPVLAIVFVAGSVALRPASLSYELGMDNREVTEHIIDRYEDGDELVHVTLNYAPTLHYLRTLAPDRRFSQTVFPADIANHPGWRDLGTVPGDSATFRAEARRAVHDLSERGARVWLLPSFGQDAFFTNILIDELEQKFELRDVSPVTGWWVSEVRTYEPPGQ